VAIRGLLVGPLQTEVVRWGGEVERVRAFMQWLGEQAPPEASIVTGDIGSSGFYANLYVYDYFGIIDPVTAHQSSRQLGRGKAGHEKHADPEYLLAKEPTYIKWGYMDRGLYERGYYFDSDLPASLNVAGIWRRDVLAKERNLQLVSRLSFEREPYAGWTATGEAFEHWPIRSAPPNQGRPVGQVGWFVSSYHPKKGDAVTGELRSAPQLLEGDVLTLRVAGGRNPRTLKVELLVDGKVVAAATGHNSEIFARKVWEISDYRGRTATLQIVDNELGGWGHIMVDEIEQWVEGPPQQ
jgi:hypothetical protein